MSLSYAPNPYAVPMGGAEPIAFDRTGISLWRVGLIVLLACFHTELIAVLLGQDEVLLRQAGNIALTGVSLGCLAWLAWRGVAFTQPFIFWPMILFGAMLTVSLFANTIFYPKPVSAWLGAHYIYLPILQVYILMALRFNDREVIAGLLATGVLAALLMVVYDLGLMPELRRYVRRSIFGMDVARIVIMKEYFFFASLALFALLLPRQVPLWVKAAAAIPLILCLALQVQIVQSRQGLVATSVGAVIILLLDRRTFELRTFLTRALFALFGLMVLPIALQPYIEMLFRDDLLHSNELNVAIRFHTFEHYLQYFLETGGLGFGMAAPSGRINNIIAESLALGVNFVDTGLYGAVLQFGILGGGIAIYMTFAAAQSGYRASRLSNPADAWRPALLCGFIVGWMCVPVPLNAFTSTDLDFGIFVFYLTWYYRNRVRFELEKARGQREVPA